MTSTEMRYLMKANGELALKYPGKYVAISSTKVVAVGGSAAEIYGSLRKRGKDAPLVTYIPKEGEKAFLS